MTATFDFQVDDQLCSGCGQCVADCVAGALVLDGQGRPAPRSGQETVCYHCQHCLAICPTGAVTIDGHRPADCRPLDREALPRLEQMEELVRSRRSVRRYRDQDVDPGLIARLLQTLDYAPTGANSRRLTFTVIQDKAAMARFRARVTERLEAAAAGPLPDQAAALATMAVAQRERDVIFRGAPHLLVVSTPADTPCPEQDVSLALATFDLLAHSAGLGTLWVGYLHRVLEFLPDLKDALGLARDRVYYGMLFGYPAVQYARTPQREGVTRVERLEAFPV